MSKVPSYVFPKYRATFAQVGAHGVTGSDNLKGAWKTKGSERLDYLAKASDNLDHAISDSKRLPFTNGQFGKFYRDYSIARTGVNVLVGSGLIPGAKERLGREEVLEAQNHLHDGFALYAADGDDKIQRYRSVDWLSHSIEDSRNALKFLDQKELSKPLLSGLSGVQKNMSKHKEVGEADVKQLDDLFAKMTTNFDLSIQAAEQAALAANAKPGATGSSSRA
jgi:hypothetical protein